LSLTTTLTELDISGNPVQIVASGSILDTGTLGTYAPNSKYFTATTIWPAYKNYNAITGAADNAYVAFVTSNEPTNTAPVVSDIPSQTINEGETFATITLDNYVTDAEDPDTSISWTPSGYTDLTVTITNRVGPAQKPSPSPQQTRVRYLIQMTRHSRSMLHQQLDGPHTTIWSAQAPQNSSQNMIIQSITGY